MTAGYVYVLANPALRADLLKIGRTDRDPFARARELHTTGTPEPFRVLFAVYVDDSKHLELHLHQALHNHRVNLSREFFSCTLPEVVDLVSRYLTDQALRVGDPASTCQGSRGTTTVSELELDDLTEALEGDGLDIVDYALEEEHGADYFDRLKTRVSRRERGAYQELLSVCLAGSKKGRAILRRIAQ